MPFSARLNRESGSDRSSEGRSQNLEDRRQKAESRAPNRPSRLNSPGRGWDRGMLSIWEKANSWVRVRATEKNFVTRKRRGFPEVGGMGSAWPVDLPTPTVRRRSLQCRPGEPRIGRAVF